MKLSVFVVLACVTIFAGFVHGGCDGAAKSDDGEVTAWFKNLGCKIQEGASDLQESAKPLTDKIGAAAKDFGNTVAQKYGEIKHKLTDENESPSVAAADSKPVFNAPTEKVLLAPLSGESQSQSLPSPSGSAAGRRFPTPPLFAKELIQCLVFRLDTAVEDGGEGLSKLIPTDMEPALQFCTHLVYGYTGISSGNRLVSLNEKVDLDVGAGLYRTITGFKKKYPNLKVLLSVGGDKDEIDPDSNKYLSLLESSNARIPFVNSAHSLIKTYGFDGLDLAWQFPKNKPKKEHGGFGKVWKGFKKLFSGDFVVDENAEQHKDEFTGLVRELKNALRPDGYILGLTVLPNVNSSLFYDIPALINNIDYVNLNAFDFQTPDRNKEVADFPAPIYELNERNPELNVNYQVQHWLNNHCPATKINVGVPCYGQAWKISKDSGITGVPPVREADGPAPEGLQTQKPGFLSWPEVCSKLPNPANQHLKGADGPLRKVNDPTKRFGPYAYRAADDNDENGIWVGYEDPDSAATKAGYVKAKGLGGIALYDLSYDDFRGACTGDKFPILRAIKYKLN